MYQLGQLVVYGYHGVCRVVGFQNRVVDRIPKQFLVLEPTQKASSQFFVPMYNSVAMGKISPLLSQQELTQMLSSDAVHTLQWIPDENRRKQCYRELSGTVCRERMAQMLYSLYAHRERQSRLGKKLHICDDNFLHDAEKILSGEIEAVLDYPSTEALKYLRDQLQPPKQAM